MVTSIACDGPLPEFLQQFLQEIGTPCEEGSPWRLRVEPGDDPTPRPLLWDLGDPLLAGAPGVAGQVPGVQAPAIGPLDRVLARADGQPVIALRPAVEGEELVIGADLTEAGLRDDPALPILLANWVASAAPAPSDMARHKTPEAPPAGAWRWAVAGGLALLWLPLPRHRRWHLAATAPLVAALVVPALSCGRDAGHRTLLLDVSQSMRRAGGDGLLAAATQALEGVARAGVVAVADRPEVWVPAETPANLARERLRALLATPLPPSHHTALDDGLALARDLSTGGDVVVVSDGRGTPPAAGRASQVVHAILMDPPATQPEATALRLAPQSAGAAVAVVQFRGPSNHSFAITWSVGERTYTQAAATGPDGWGESRLAIETGGGAWRVAARLDGGPPSAALVAPAGPPVVLAVGRGTPPPVPGVVLESVAPERLAMRLAGGPAPAAVILDNAPAAALGPVLLETLTRQVRGDGLGLLMTGGPAGMGGGGYHESPLEPALPLLLDRPPGRAPVAVAVVLDRSGSMVEGTAPSLDLGVAAVLAVRRGLDRGDRWALLAFDVAIHTLDPLGPPPEEGGLRRRLATLQGGGGTDPWLALRQAAAVLAEAHEASRHLVLVTDGHLPPPPPAWQEEALTGVGLVLDLVQVGTAPPSVAAVALAEATGGAVHSIAGAAALPAAIAMAGRGGDETPFRAGDFRFRPAAATAPLPLATGTVDGYCPGQTAPGGVAVLHIAGGAPLLVLGRHGLGRTAVWTGRTAALLTQPGLWQGLVAWLTPPPSDDLECLLSGATLRVTYRTPMSPPLPPGGGRGEGAWTEQNAGQQPRGDAQSDRPHPSPPPEGEGGGVPFSRIESPDGPVRTFPLARTPAGEVWSATTDLPAAGHYRIEVARAEGGPGLAEQFVLLEPDPEWAISPAAGKAVLARLARESGGRLVVAGEPLPPPPRDRAPWHAHPPLLLLAGAILLLSPRPASFRGVRAATDDTPP
jgi:Mg-chelatase subunit ChlD